jgi:hypothetical protein
MFIVRQARMDHFGSMELLTTFTANTSHPQRSGTLRCRPSAALHVISEVEMSKKFLIAAAATILVASTGLASAQQRAQAPRDYVHAPYVNSYYDRAYWDAVASKVYVRPDPFVGTIWEGVVPY